MRVVNPDLGDGPKRHPVLLGVASGLSALAMVAPGANSTTLVAGTFAPVAPRGDQPALTPAAPSAHEQTAHENEGAVTGGGSTTAADRFAQQRANASRARIERQVERQLRSPMGSDRTPAEQTGATTKLIAAQTKLGPLDWRASQQVLGYAAAGGVQPAELSALRRLARKGRVQPETRERLIDAVDAISPAGAPTAKLAAILARVDADNGREQLIELLERAKNPVRGGPRTFVVDDAQGDYLASITTGQVIAGLVKYLDGATPPQAQKIRQLLNEQLDALSTPVPRGGLQVRGMTGEGLALSVNTAEGETVAVNQSAFVLSVLERISLLQGPQNEQLRARASSIAKRVAIELRENVKFCYLQQSVAAYGFKMRDGVAVITRYEDGDHLQTTLNALRSLQQHDAMFESTVKAIDARYPDVRWVGPDDLDGTSGHIYSGEYVRMRLATTQARLDGKVTKAELEQLEKIAQRDGYQTAGETVLLNAARRDT